MLNQKAILLKKKERGLFMCKECKGEACKYYMWNRVDWWIWSCILALPKLE